MEAPGPMPDNDPRFYEWLSGHFGVPVEEDCRSIDMMMEGFMDRSQEAPSAGCGAQSAQVEQPAPKGPLPVPAKPKRVRKPSQAQREAHRRFREKRKNEMESLVEEVAKKKQLVEQLEVEQNVLLCRLRAVELMLSMGDHHLTFLTQRMGSMSVTQPPQPLLLDGGAPESAVSVEACCRSISAAHPPAAASAAAQGAAGSPSWAHTPSSSTTSRASGSMQGDAVPAPARQQLLPGDLPASNDPGTVVGGSSKPAAAAAWGTLPAAWRAPGAGGPEASPGDCSDLVARFPGGISPQSNLLLPSRGPNPGAMSAASAASALRKDGWHQAVLEMGAHYKDYLAAVTPLVLSVEASGQPDPAVEGELQQRLDEIRAKLTEFSLGQRVPIYLVNTLNLETGAVEQEPPAGHWRQVMLLLPQRLTEGQVKEIVGLYELYTSIHSRIKQARQQLLLQLQELLALWSNPSLRTDIHLASEAGPHARGNKLLSCIDSNLRREYVLEGCLGRAVSMVVPPGVIAEMCLRSYPFWPDLNAITLELVAWHAQQQQQQQWQQQPLRQQGRLRKQSSS